MERTKVWRLPVRLFHAALPLLIAGLFLTSESESWLSWHARLGLAVLALVVGRIVWGFVGDRPARFSEFVPSPRGLLRYAGAYVRGRPPETLSHNPIGALMVLAMLAVLLAATVTGVLLYGGPEFEGPLSALFTKRSAHLVEELHEGLAGALVAMVVAHVAGVLVSSVLEKQNLPLSMVTGYKRGPREAQAEPGPIRLGVGLVAAAIAGVLAVAAAALFLPATADAADETPAALLAAYAAEAGAGFQPSAARGAALYREEHVVDGKPTSCATCHTGDPRGKGKSPAGKIVEPLTPSVNPERFTDRKHAEKWYGRNCKQVLGRACTPAEKADFLAFVLAPEATP